MDPKTRAVNSAEYLKSLIFLNKKDFAIKKLIELIPHVNQADSESKIVILKILPVFFGFAEVNRCLLEECGILIRKVKNNPVFENEKRLLDGWQNRFKKLLSDRECWNETKVDCCNKNNRYFRRVPPAVLNDYVGIGYTDLDLFSRYAKWLKFHKLHKYLYFFANLSYAEILAMNSSNIRYYERKVDLHEMTEGGRNAILRKLAELGKRASRLETFTQNEYFTNVSKIEKSIHEMKTILKTPIRKDSIVPVLLIKAMETVVFVTMNLSKNDFIKVYNAAVSLLKMAWACSFFGAGVKDKLNVFQSTLHSKSKSFSYSKRRTQISVKDRNNNHIYINQNNDVWALHIEIENGIKAISLYLEKYVLEDV